MDLSNYTNKAREALENAFILAKNNKNTVIEIAHLCKSVLQVDNYIANFFFDRLNIDQSSLFAKLDEFILRIPKGIIDNPALSNSLYRVLENAKNISSKMGDSFISIEHLLLSIVREETEVSKYLCDIGCKYETIVKIMEDLRGKNKSDSQSSENQYQTLERYARNLNKLAKEGKIDPVIGRDDEIRMTLQILSRRTKNNPMLIGEPGVGKTAIVEGLAQRIIKGDVPESMKSKVIMSLDMALIIAGAKYKGEFEERLKGVVKEVSDSEGEIILFIDEIHTLVGAGSGGEGAMDAANILKPALSRGELHTIGATTLSEYQKYIEKDKALERRFQKIIINEPSITDAISILRGIKDKYELHHGVRIKDSAIIAAVQLSSRYIPERFLPDKAIDLIDAAAAKLRIEIDSVPEVVDTISRKIMQLEIEREAVRREGDKSKELQLTTEIDNLKQEEVSLRAQWDSEKKVIHEIRKYKHIIEDLNLQAQEAEKNFQYAKVAEIRYGKIVDAQKKLTELQEEAGKESQGRVMLKEEILESDIAETIAKWTGIPIDKLLENERSKLLRIEDELRKRVINQEAAITAVANAIRRSRVGLQDPQKPIGSFMFLGTSGVGKTEVARALASLLFDSESAMIRIDMSEFQEKYNVSRLIGSPPGYVGYEEGGQLTEAVRHKPYAVILLDEIEKAHPDVFNILLQVLDDGRLTDNKGRVVNFKNTIIIMTTNFGSSVLQQYLGNDVDHAIALEKVQSLLKEYMKPEFLNRIDEIIVFNSLTKNFMRDIIKLQMAQIQNRLKTDSDITLVVDDSVIDFLSKMDYDISYGARPVKRIIQRFVLDELSVSLLNESITKKKAIKVFFSQNNVVEFENIG